MEKETLTLLRLILLYPLALESNQGSTSLSTVVSQDYIEQLEKRLADPYESGTEQIAEAAGAGPLKLVKRLLKNTTKGGGEMNYFIFKDKTPVACQRPRG